ncbi:hypothetical protein [Dyadobacter sp. CY323]|uniref:hypothetical protein n=1 Tax=Dyadobacter sp. CY323 TaxID=2907302 RepID=UPI001F161419|nr:hypothetical protein [Dyadobacter sp. CY323]MCE6988627.1 hypothetical protein [Dyadobacter sp. CY323]
MDHFVIPECFVDTNLIETISPPRDHYNHQKGCGTVTKVMREKYGNDFAVGIIDKDKVEVDYLKEFDIVHQDGSLVLHKHPNKNHYIIQICPAMERFIMKCATDSGISLKDFDLPEDLNGLRKVSKKVTSKDDVKFKLLFKKLVKINNVEVIRLREWINYLKNNMYNVDLKTLINI